MPLNPWPSNPFLFFRFPYFWGVFQFPLPFWVFFLSFPRIWGFKKNYDKSLTKKREELWPQWLGGGSYKSLFLQNSGNVSPRAGQCRCKLVPKGLPGTHKSACPKRTLGKWHLGALDKYQQEASITWCDLSRPKNPRKHQHLSHHMMSWSPQNKHFWAHVMWSSVVKFAARFCWGFLITSFQESQNRACSCQV